MGVNTVVVVSVKRHRHRIDFWAGDTDEAINTMKSANINEESGLVNGDWEQNKNCFFLLNLKNK